MNDLVFFDKEGNYLNFQYDTTLELWTGDLIFHENSNDTFKTIGLYLFERVPGFEFSNGFLKLEKFQLFNEWGFNITGNNFGQQSITKIEPINNDSTFFSKWIYGEDFERKFPLGSELRFDQSIFEFTTTNKTYTVVSSKKDAVMIISDTNNSNFNASYSTLIGVTSSYNNKTVTAINSIGIKNYGGSSSTNLSAWSEPMFWSNLYNSRKLNLINTDLNDKVLTVKNNQIEDKKWYEYSLTASSFSQSSDLWMQVTLKTDLPLIYQGAINVLPSKIEFSDTVPSVLKPGTEFKILSSINTEKYPIANINSFDRDNRLRSYAIGDQILWNNTVYECLQSYTQSATSSITPDNTTYWTLNITYLPVGISMSSEVLADTQLYLTNNIFTFETKASAATASPRRNELTLASAVQQWSDEFANLNIDLTFNDNILKASLNYPSNWAEVNFYRDVLGSASLLLGTSSFNSQRTFEVEETLSQELSENISEIVEWEIVFTDIDSYGISIFINGIDYSQEAQVAIDGLSSDLSLTIDKTLRAWVDSYFATLLRLGISVKLGKTEVASPFELNDTLIIKTFYPNVPLDFEVRVGTTANYYVKHSEVEFLEIGSILRLVINGRRYDSIFGSQSLLVSEKLQSWIDEYGTTLDDFEIFVRNKNNTLAFNVKEQSRQLTYDIYIGKTPLPGENSFAITKKAKGNIGALITSNSIITATSASASATFFDVNGASAGQVSFATGQVVSVNNSIYPFNNQDYNIIEVNVDRLILSYQGPFWGATTSETTYPNIQLKWDSGFDESLTDDVDVANVDSWYNWSFSPDKGFDGYLGYSATAVGIPSDVEAITDITDIVYVPQASRIYVLGSNIKVFSSETGDFLETIVISGITTPVSLVYNTTDNFLYALTYDKLYRIDPVTYDIYDQISLGYTATSKSDLDIELNTANGDIYVSCTSASSLKKVGIGATSSTSFYSSSATYKMAYDTRNNALYVITASDTIREFSGSTLAQLNTYSVAGSTSRNTIVFDRSNEAIFVMGNSLTSIKNSEVTTLGLSATSFNSLFSDKTSSSVIVSQNSLISSVSDESIYWSVASSKWGYVINNDFDDRLWLASQNSAGVYIIDRNTGQILNQVEGLSGYATKLVYNYSRSSVWTIIPSSTQVIELNADAVIYYRYRPQEEYENKVNYDGVQYGTLDQNYIEPSGIWLTTRDYIRRPRFNFEGETEGKFIWTWEEDDVEEIFLYDFSGDQLEKTGSYRYVGEKPLSNIQLNKKPNRDLSKVATPEAQQTIFSEILYDIDFINSSYNLSFLPQPLECFIGYKADDEGTHESILLLKLREDITYKISSTSNNNNVVTFENITDRTGFYGKIQLGTQSSSTFLQDENELSSGLRSGQIIRIEVKDITNTKNKYLSFNSGVEVKIREIYAREIIVDFYDLFFQPEASVLDYNEITTYLEVTLHVLDKNVARISIKGQTEIEDIRYKINLGNSGKLINSDDVFIFKTYDINEQGIDWQFLNRKRKEMLLVKDQIYPYIGSYKAIINAINYFGYNDLEFYEYYRNIDFFSDDFGKLVKVEVPDIFDNTVEGWKENDWIKWTLPNPKFEDTNLFNLTYRITDREGNNVLIYSLAEVITKLMGLKRWLQSNVIPITHKIYDITGRADFVQTNTIVHKSYAVKSYKITQSMSPVDLSLNEAYLMPVNSGSSVYNCVIDFTVQNKDWVPDYFELRIKTFKTYPEWQPFKTYSRGQIVSYYGDNWESTKDNNRLNNPRKYLDTSSWNSTTDYYFGATVEYKDLYYVYIGTQSSITATASNPFVDNLNGEGLWNDITQWKKLDYVPVQNLKEYRTGTHSFNFTLDSNIDPYIVAEVTSDNGYGLTWTSKKSYEIRGILGLQQPLQEVDTPGPIKIWDRIVTATASTVPSTEYIKFWEAITPDCINE
jgi:hypothetical protein